MERQNLQNTFITKIQKNLKNLKMVKYRKTCKAEITANVTESQKSKFIDSPLSSKNIQCRIKIPQDKRMIFYSGP